MRYLAGPKLRYIMILPVLRKHNIKYEFLNGEWNGLEILDKNDNLLMPFFFKIRKQVVSSRMVNVLEEIY